MGFEIVYKYHPKTEKGYDTSEVEDLKKELGKPFEDVPLEKVAAAIMLDMARRDIWIVKVEVTELVKKKVEFRESDGGIVLKNKKFSLDSLANALEERPIAQAVPVPPQPQVPQVPQPQVPQPLPHESMIPPARQGQQQQPRQPLPHENMVPPARQGQAPPVAPAPVAAPAHIPHIRKETFDPDPELIRTGAKVNGKFTMGKAYPILSEGNDPREMQTGERLPILYQTVDDRNKKVSVSSLYFIPMQRGLIGGNEFNEAPVNIRGGGGGRSNDGLIWPGMEGNNYDIPDLR
jgi:hypothetical protein